MTQLGGYYQKGYFLDSQLVVNNISDDWIRHDIKVLDDC